MNKIKHLVAITLTYFMASACSIKEDIPVELTNNTLLSNMDIAVDDIYSIHKSKLNTIGLSIGILKNGETHFYGYGETKKGNGSIPNENTFYEIGSITKTFTAIMATNMLLQQDMNIETTIKSYLPEDLPTLNRNGIELNFKHLLTHTSGLTRMPSNFNFTRNPTKEYAAYDERHLYAFLENARIHANPFTKFSYSNLGMGVVGNILERNYAMDYGEVLEKELTNPLGLLNTTAYFEKTEVEKWATGYNYQGKETDYWKSLNALDGAGVIKSTAKDLLKYAEVNINPPASELGEAIRMTHEVYFMEHETSDYSKTRNCLGWFEYVHNNLPEETFLWHSGGTGGFNSELFINLNNQSALVLLFNKSATTSQREDLISDMLQLIVE